MKRYAIMCAGEIVTLVTYDAESAEEAIKKYVEDAREWCPDYVPDDRIYAEVI